MTHASVLAVLARHGADVAPFGARVEVHGTVGSTNDLAAQLAHDGAPEGTLVVADAQTQGRGRRGATWQSAAGAGLYVSVVLRPGDWAAAARNRNRAHAFITLAAGVATVDALRDCGAARAVLKWPNDIVVHTSTPDEVVSPPNASETGRPRRWRKLAGLLAEGATTGGALQHVVLGIGVNLRRVAPDSTLEGLATTLADEAGGEEQPDEIVLVTLLRALARERRRLAHGDTAALVAAWRQRSPSSRGWLVSWEDGGRMRTGRTASIDDEGALLVETAEGVARVLSGTLNW